MQIAPLTALFLLSFSSQGVELAFAPATDLELTKTFSVVRDVNVDTCDLAIDDHEFPIGTGMNHASSFTLVVTDTYEKLDGQAVLALVRSFDTVQREFENTNVPDNVRITEGGDLTGPLEGFAVRFDWDEEAEEHLASFVEDDSDDAEEPAEEWLEGLSLDLDLAGFLPEEEVAVGDSWSVESDVLVALLAPGGTFTWGDDGDDEVEDDDALRIIIPGVGDRQYYDALEGDVTAKLVSADDDRCVIEITFGLEAEMDLVEHLTETAGDDETTERVFDEAEGTLGLGGIAELIWNTERGTFESFTLEADLENSLDATWSNSRVNEGDVELTLYSEESGTLAIEASTAR